MAAVGVLQGAQSRIDARIEDGDEVGGASDLLQDTVKVLDDCGRAGEFAGAKAEDYGQRRHEQ